MRQKGVRRKQPVRVVYVTPQGEVFSQRMAQELAKEEDLIFLCGHYEGIDERVLEEIVTDYVSIGDYVLTGGELPAMVMIDAISRMVPGVLKNEESAETESFQDGLLEYPQYTRPRSGMPPRAAHPAFRRSCEGGKMAPGAVGGTDQAEASGALRSVQPQGKGGFLPDKGPAEPYGHAGGHPAGNTRSSVRAEEAGVLLYDRPSGAWMLSASDADMGERLLSEIPADRKTSFSPCIRSSCWRALPGVFTGTA